MIAALVAAIAILGGGYLWVRQSSLVAVRQVQITGLSGPDASEIRSALVSAARTMTTLDVQLGRLHTAVSPYPVVKGLRVTTHFPHGMRIQVVEQVPVAVLDVAGQQTSIAADGTVLHGVAPQATLPVITASVTPGGTHVTGAVRSEVQMLAAAPYTLLARIATASSDSTHGIVAQLRNGPRIYFGDSTQLAAKWRAAVEALADPRSAGADYIDVTVPARPAAGTGSDGGTSASSTTGVAPGATVTTTATTADPAAPSTTATAPAPATTGAAPAPSTTATATATAPAPATPAPATAAPAAPSGGSTGGTGTSG